MAYQLTIDEQPSYLHATVTGTHSAENAIRFLKEAHEACVQRGHSAVLLEMNLAGPSLDMGSIFGVIAQRSADGLKLRKIGYVDASARDPEKLKFAETVAVNRGLNVRLFRDIEDAKRWMSETPGPS
jgi:hypothetical protein